MLDAILLDITKRDPELDKYIREYVNKTLKEQYNPDLVYVWLGSEQYMSHLAMADNGDIISIRTTIRKLKLGKGGTQLSFGIGNTRRTITVLDLFAKIWFGATRETHVIRWADKDAPHDLGNVRCTPKAEILEIVERERKNSKVTIGELAEYMGMPESSLRRVLAESNEGLIETRSTKVRRKQAVTSFMADL